jgi:hypothetical protein
VLGIWNRDSNFTNRMAWILMCVRKPLGGSKRCSNSGKGSCLADAQTEDTDTVKEKEMREKGKSESYSQEGNTEFRPF